MKTLKRGSATVEAALLMPIIIFVIVALIYLGFYLHDKAVTKFAANYMATKICQVYTYEFDINTSQINYDKLLDRNILSDFSLNIDDDLQEIYEYVADMLKLRLIICTPGEMTCDYSYNQLLQILKVSTIIEIDMEMPFGNLKNLFEGRLKEQGYAKSVDAIKFIHINDAIKNE
jgi:TadE-like protein